MKKIISLLFCVLAMNIICISQARGKGPEMEKVNIGKKLALYPSVVAVIGTTVNGKVNWMTIAHMGAVGHSMIMVSMSQDHYSTKGVIENNKLSLNLVERSMLPQVDYVGTVSGSQTDKSGVFKYHMGENGSPIIDASPVSIELDVIDNYKAGGFDNFILLSFNLFKLVRADSACRTFIARSFT